MTSETDRWFDEPANRAVIEAPNDMHSLWSLLIRRYLRFAERHALLVVLACALLAFAGLWQAQQLSVNPRLEALLPADSPALPAIEELSERVPSSSPLYLLVASEDAALNRRLAEALRDGASRWPETIYALSRRDPSYFLDRRLLFLPAADLKQLAYQIEDIVDYEECAAVPGCVNLDERPEDPSEAALRSKIAAIPEVKNLLSLFGLQGLPDDEGTATAAAKVPVQGAARPSADDGAQLGDLCSEDGQVCAVTVFIQGSPADLALAEHMGRRAETLFAQVRPADAPSSLRMSTSGSYRNIPLTKKAVGRDLSLTAAVSTGLILLLVMLQFRGARALLLIFAPLASASAWTLGLIALLHPELNVISAFTLAVLAGLGIDFGEHILTHYGTERGRGVDVSAALTTTYETLGGPMGVACITSGCGFGALMIADFRGFAEMGGMAALGVGLSLVAFVLMLPALVHVLHRVRPERSTVLRTFALKLPHLQRPARLCRALVYGGLAVALAAAVLGTRVDFEYNFRNLQAKTVGHGINYGKALHGTTRSAVVMLTDSSAELEATARDLRAENPEKAAAEQAWLLTPASFVPPDQQERLQAIELLRGAVARAEKRLSSEDRAAVAHLEPLLSVREPITPDALPRWVREWLTDTAGEFGTFGLMYNDLRGSDARAMETLANELKALSQRFPNVRFASPEALLGLVVPGLRHDAPRMLGWALLGLFVSTLALSRSLVKTLTVLLPLSLAASLSLALMVLLDLKVNMYNMLVFPLSFGIGIDGAVYVVWTMSRYNRETTPKELAVTARGVLGSTTTTAAGFGAMIVASNPGLVSLGELATITLGCSLAINLLWLPALMYLRHGPPDAPPAGLQLSQNSEMKTP